jgi:hypothetical protein
MSTIMTNQNAGNNYSNYTDMSYNQGSTLTESRDTNAAYFESNDMVALSEESKYNQSSKSKKSLADELNKTYKPGFMDKVCHIGRSDTEISAIKMKDDFMGNLKNGPQKDNPVADQMFSTAVDFMQEKIGVSVGLPGEMVTKGAEAMMGCIGNDNYLGALNGFKEWRTSHPNASKSEIMEYVRGEMNKPFNSMAMLSDSMNAGTLNMSDTDRQNYMKNKDAMLSALMESSYKNMNTMYGNKW